MLQACFPEMNNNFAFLDLYVYYEVTGLMAGTASILLPQFDDSPFRNVAQSSRPEECFCFWT